MALTKVIGSGVGELTNKVGLGLSSPAAVLHVQTSTDGTGLSGDDTYVARFHNQEATSDRSFGVDIQAGSSTTDQALRIKDHDGTNTLMIVDGLGHITKPKQSAFLVTMSSNSAQFGTSGLNPSFDTEIFDQNADFASNTFTAPVTGRYYLSCLLYGYYLDNDATYYFFSIQTSNRNYYKYLGGGQWDSDAIFYGVDIQLLVDMDANDTASISVGQNGGHSSSQILASNSFFSGHLVC